MYKVLIDNNLSIESGLQAEHGLSLYFESGEGRFLLDTGLSGKAFDNAAVLGIDISAVDALILSHGHNDHTGGLERFFSINKKAKVYASAHIFDWQYQSTSRGYLHSLSPDKRILEQYSHRFVAIDTDYHLSEDIYLVFNHSDVFPQPPANSFLSIIDSQGERPYRAEDEISVCIARPEGLHILAPCSHAGMPNIIASCQEVTGVQNVCTYAGGLHLPDLPESKLKEEQLLYIDSLTATLLPLTQLSLRPMHCTGSDAMQILKKYYL